ncbi:hypothetical protein [Halioxenophilus aromaticivorans]|uniref:hypothetical protein n=1 Tax=Halioxenophilus aromaticivorans TaxID=1306992 RepID=UPI0031E7A61C
MPATTSSRDFCRKLFTNTDFITLIGELDDHCRQPNRGPDWAVEQVIRIGEFVALAFRQHRFSLVENRIPAEWFFLEPIVRKRNPACGPTASFYWRKILNENYSKNRSEGIQSQYLHTRRASGPVPPILADLRHYSLNDFKGQLNENNRWALPYLLEAEHIMRWVRCQYEYHHQARINLADSRPKGFLERVIGEWHENHRISKQRLQQLFIEAPFDPLHVHCNLRLLDKSPNSKPSLMEELQGLRDSISDKRAWDEIPDPSWKNGDF